MKKEKKSLNYKKLGLKCGIEIHQQLDTNKLFCSCPPKIREDEPDILVRRKMRAVPGEVGDIDPAALHEFLRDRDILYQGYSDTNCLVELDEEPPHQLNTDALEIALESSLMLNARVVDELQVMRKTVIDGSNTSGFQRTVLVAMDGFLDTEEGRVGIPTICLEEDAARKIKEDGNTVVYRLDRLGIPLVEIGTSPDIKSSGQAREVAEKLGLILRATGKVKRGLGTIRQDLNVSISQGERIEVKGVQDLRLIKKVVELEVGRQLMLIGIAQELKKRGLKERELKEEILNATTIFRNTKSKLILGMLEKGSVVMAVKLPKFDRLLRGKLGPELAQYVKSVGVRGIFHSDELPGYGISESEVRSLSKRLGLTKGDAFVLVVENKDLAGKALREVVKRCRIAIKGVPEEARRAMDDGSTEFMRPLPGSARMYPETDQQVIPIGKELLHEIRKNLSELPEEKLKNLVERGLSEELANQLMRSKFSEEFHKFRQEFSKVKASVIATVLLSMPKEARKRYNARTENLRKEHYRQILDFLNRGKISKDHIPELMAEMTNNLEKSLDKILKEKGISLLSLNELEREVDKLIQENVEFVQESGERALGPLIGKAMERFKGRADGKTLSKIIRKRLKK